MLTIDILKRRFIYVYYEYDDFENRSGLRRRRP